MTGTTSWLCSQATEPHHGYHTVCYNRLTANLDCLKDEHVDQESSTSYRPKRFSSDKVLFKPDSIFCRSENPKKVKRRQLWATEGLSIFEREGWKNILEIAPRKGDKTLLRRIRGLWKQNITVHVAVVISKIQPSGRVKTMTRDKNRKNGRSA